MAGSETIDIKADNRVLFVKVRFNNTEKDSEQKLYGQLFLVLTNSYSLESFNGLISTFSDTYDIELHTNWDKYEEFIAERKWKGHFSLNLTNTLSTYLEDLKNDKQLYKFFYTTVVNYDYNKLDVLLYDIINKALHEKSLIIETVIQETTQDDYKATREMRNKPQESDEDADLEAKADKIMNEKVLLEVKPVLAPVKGKPIYSLKTGDIIMIRVLANTQRQVSYIKLLGLELDGRITVPIAADIIDIKYGTSKFDAYEITVKIDDNIYGKVIETERQIKLRIYDPKTDGARLEGFFGGSKLYAKKKKNDRVTKAFIMVLSIFLTILIVVILYVFFTW